MTGILKPALFLETAVQHGFSSAFILQALENNGSGRLVSIDLPHTGGEYLDQGTSLLPVGVQLGGPFRAICEIGMTCDWGTPGAFSRLISRPSHPLTSSCRTAIIATIT